MPDQGSRRTSPDTSIVLIGSGTRRRIHMAPKAICSRQPMAASCTSDSLVALSVSNPKSPPSDHDNH